MKLMVSGLYRADMPPSRSGWESGIERVPSRTANTGRRGHPGPGCVLRTGVRQRQLACLDPRWLDRASPLLRLHE